MPAHTNAAIASYPELGCSRPTPGVSGGTQAPGLYTGIAVGFSSLCPDSATTFKFVDDVVRELSAMTPGPYFHVGGDEVQALTNEQYSRFVERVQEIVYKYGKTMIGWEEIGKAKLRPTTIAQQWKSDSALFAFRQGAKLILSPAEKIYLDMKYTPATELGLTSGRPVAVTERSSARYRHWPFRCCSSPFSCWGTRNSASLDASRRAVTSTQLSRQRTST